MNREATPEEYAEFDSIEIIGSPFHKKKQETQFFRFEKKNEEDKNYICLEVWEDKEPGNISVRQLEEYEDDYFKNSLTKILEISREAGKKLKNPVLTIQGDIGKGTQIGYCYEEKDEVPPNAQGYTIKPLFDKSIKLIRFSLEENRQGKSIVYSSPLSSFDLDKKLIKLDNIFRIFFENPYKAKEILKIEPNFFRQEVIIDNEALRNIL